MHILNNDNKGYETLLLEEKDFYVNIDNNKQYKKILGQRFSKVLIPGKFIDKFETTDLFYKIRGLITIGGTLKYTKFIKY